MTLTRRRTTASLAGLQWLATRSVLALEPRHGRVVLTMSGRLGNPDMSSQASFDMPMLEPLPQASLVTRTRRHSGPQAFTGPLPRGAPAEADAQGGNRSAFALDDHRAGRPFEVTRRRHVLPARRRDDKAMAVRDQGPLFITCPFDAAPELRNSLGTGAWHGS